MNLTITSYFSALLSLLVLDGLWLGLFAKSFYKQHLGYLMTTHPQWMAAGLFYLAYALGITVLVVLPSLKSQTGFGQIFLLGALLGFIAYGAYDFTNQATIRDWPMIVTIVDLLWGTFVTGIASTAAAFVARLITR